MSKRDRKHHYARSVMAVLDLLADATSPVISTQALRAFLAVAREEGRTMDEIATAIDGKRSTVSRQLLDLAASDRNGNPGYGLIEVLPHPLIPCANSYFLTEKGRATVSELLRLMQPAKSEVPPPAPQCHGPFRHFRLDAVFDTSK